MRLPGSWWQRLVLAVVLTAACSGTRAAPAGVQTGSGVAEGGVGLACEQHREGQLSLLKVVAHQIGSSMSNPTNHRNKRL